jgi:hypothetical protein
MALRKLHSLFELGRRIAMSPRKTKGAKSKAKKGKARTPAGKTATGSATSKTPPRASQAAKAGTSPKKGSTYNSVVSDKAPPLGFCLTASDTRPKVELKNSPLKDYEKCRIIVSQEAYVQLRAFFDLTNIEVSALGTVRRDEFTFYVDRFFLIKQEGHAGGTDLDQDAMAELVTDLVNSGRNDEATSLHCWFHSHNNMGTFWSGQDEEAISNVGADFMVAIVAGKGFELKARIDFRQPLPVSVDDVPVIYDVAAAAKWEDLKKELKEKVRKTGGFKGKGGSGTKVGFSPRSAWGGTGRGSHFSSRFELEEDDKDDKVTVGGKEVSLRAPQPTLGFHYCQPCKKVHRPGEACKDKKEPATTSSTSSADKGTVEEKATTSEKCPSCKKEGVMEKHAPGVFRCGQCRTLIAKKAA